MHLPVRFDTFLWLVPHDKLLINTECYKRRMTTDPSCLQCALWFEILDHVFRHFQSSLSIWQQFLFPQELLQYFGLTFDEWLHVNLQHSHYVFLGKQSPLVFAGIPHFIWKWHCDMIFHNAFQLPRHPATKILQFISCWAQANTPASLRLPAHIIPIHWHPLLVGFVKLIMDGGCTFSGEISDGGILCGVAGNWIAGITKNIGCGSILEAELWRIS